MMAELTCDDDEAVEAVEAAAAADRATVAIRHGLRRSQHQIQVKAVWSFPQELDRITL